MGRPSVGIAGVLLHQSAANSLGARQETPVSSSAEHTVYALSGKPFNFFSLRVLIG